MGQVSFKFPTWRGSGGGSRGIPKWITLQRHSWTLTEKEKDPVSLSLQYFISSIFYGSSDSLDRHEFCPVRFQKHTLRLSSERVAQILSRWFADYTWYRLLSWSFFNWIQFSMYIYCLVSCLCSIVFDYYWIYRVYFGFSLISKFQRIEAGCYFVNTDSVYHRFQRRFKGRSISG